MPTLMASWMMMTDLVSSGATGRGLLDLHLRKNGRAALREEGRLDRLQLGGQICGIIIQHVNKL